MKSILNSIKIRTSDFFRMWRWYRKTGVWPTVVSRVGQPQKGAR